MGRYYKRNRGEKGQTAIQKFNWRSHKVCDTYDQASTVKKELVEKGNKFVKIRRCGPDGIKFRIKVGTPVKKKTEKSDVE